MKLSQLTFLGFYLNGAQGTKKYDYMSIDIVKRQLETGNIFPYLQKEMKLDIDTTVLSEVEQRTLTAEWLDFSSCINESRKLCVDNGGLCLLVAYIFESIQRLNAK